MRMGGTTYFVRFPYFIGVPYVRTSDSIDAKLETGGLHSLASPTHHAQFVSGHYPLAVLRLLLFITLKLTRM